jgi:hypothetical protein
MEISPRFTIVMLMKMMKTTTGIKMAADVAIADTTGGMIKPLQDDYDKYKTLKVFQRFQTRFSYVCFQIALAHRTNLF